MNITEDLEIKKICGKMVTKLLTETQKKRHVQVCQDILKQLQTELTLLKRVITGDESWIFKSEPLIKRQILEWKSALSPKTEKRGCLNSKPVKVMLIAFLMSRELFMHNSCHKVKSSTRTSTKTSRVVG